MTKGKAIEILRECVTSGRAITNGCHINDTEYEVLKIAIKALEQQPCDDCVSRADVITIIQNHWWNCKDIDQLVKALPPVTPTHRWIPVSEKLPEVGEKVLCQCQANIYEVLKLTVDGWYHDNNHCYMLGFVIAWQPLPQPYEEKRDNEND